KQSAAVLIPFCNVNETPGILLQVRSRSMRSHSGEVSFPGGKVDELLDLSLLDCALRECAEEMGIARNRVELLGALHPPEKSLRGDTVWPFVGFVHRRRNQHKFTPYKPKDDALPSLDMSAIEQRASKDEVAAIFHLPLAELANPSRSRAYMFRNEHPYWAVDVSDLVPGEGQPFVSESLEKPQMDEVGAGGEGRLEVWGLTGWYLGLLAKRLSSLYEP
ncbi:NUDIX hydrolase domain-like protein, partial [Mycena alexandri]